MVCTVSNEQTVPSPEEVAGGSGKLVFFGGCEVDGDECPELTLRWPTLRPTGWPKTGGTCPPWNGVGCAGRSSPTSGRASTTACA